MAEEVMRDASFTVHSYLSVTNSVKFLVNVMVG